jgi:hypothetical protein
MKMARIGMTKSQIELAATYATEVALEKTGNGVLVTGQLFPYPQLLGGGQAMAASLTSRDPTAGKTLQHLSRVQAFCFCSSRSPS